MIICKEHFFVTYPRQSRPVTSIIVSQCLFLMKYISLVSLALLFFVRTNAQIPFNTIDSIAINNISAAVLVHGDMWWNPATENSRCTFRSKNASISFTGGLWMSGYDGAGQLHVAAQTYRQDGNDYWPGLLDNTATLNYATSYRWARIWKVNRTDIQLFNSITHHTPGNVPQTILKWPGKGNTYAEGSNGLSLSVTTDMAPFVDANSNGIYEPLSGDYPDVKGDQALWWVFSDNGPAHSQSDGNPLGVEVHAMAYAYNRGTPLDYVMYYEYNVVNRSPNNYNNFRFGLFNDVDLGYYLDDFIGFDSSRRLAIGYNGTNSDGQSGGFPANSYGNRPPQMGITMISLPGDAGSSHVPAGSFVFFNNDASIIGNPTSAAEFDNYLRAKRRNGQHWTRFNPPCSISGTPIETNYVFPGNVADPSGWSECACSNIPSDRRMVFASNDFTLNAGSSQKILLALVTTDTGAGGCGGAISFDKIRAVSDAAWDGYHNPPAPLPLSQADVQGAPVHVYPNPASDKLYIDGIKLQAEEEITVCNPLGQQVALPTAKKNGGAEIDISALSPGVYHIRFAHSSRIHPVTFVKE
jgi:hypothetical protein